MESELSRIFRVKLVTKNIVRGSPGTQFMHMRVKMLSGSHLALPLYLQYFLINIFRQTADLNFF